MIVFTLKMIKNIRKAIAGRRHPHQLAGAVALGVLLGIIPHGNLLALLVVFLVLCCKVNHAATAVVAIGVTFVATKLDPYSHQVGQFVLSHDTTGPMMQKAWTLPLMPWTDLNNTVVMGSFVIGLVALFPVFVVTLPVFRLFKPDEDAEEQAAEASRKVAEAKKRGANHLSTHSGTQAAPAGEPQVQPAVAATDVKDKTTSECDEKHPTSDETDRGAEPSLDENIPFEESMEDSTGDENKHSVVLVHGPHDNTLPPRFSGPAKKQPLESIPFDSEDFFTDSPSDRAAVNETKADKKGEANEGETDDAESSTPEQLVSVDTRIDVVRIKPSDESTTNEADSPDTPPEQPMDEALNYLLRQLRNSQERKAAG